MIGPKRPFGIYVCGIFVIHGAIRARCILSLFNLLGRMLDLRSGVRYLKSSVWFG